MDKVKPLKIEDLTDGSMVDFSPTEVNPAQDYIAAKGVSFANSDDIFVDTDGTDMRFTDLNTNNINTLEELAFGAGRYFLRPSEYWRVPQYHSHVVPQEVALAQDSEYDVRGELAIIL